MYQDQGAKAVPQQERAATLNDRLNRVADLLSYQCERIESMLERVNGAASSPGRPPRGAEVAQIRPTIALATVVENLEKDGQRLANLVTGVELVA